MSMETDGHPQEPVSNLEGRTSCCFATLESNTCNRSARPCNPTRQEITSFSEWLATGVAVPFVVALVLFLTYVQILPRLNHVPHLGFLAQYNPRLRQDVMYPQSPSTIDFGMMCLFFTGCWCLFAGVHELYLHKSRSSFYRFLTLSLAFGETMLLTNATTDFIKFRLGALRPDFLHRCFGPRVTLEDLPLSLPQGLASCPRMNDNPDVILDGLVSFPSGHTSMATSCGFFLSYYLFACVYGVNVSTFKFVRRHRQHPRLSPLVQQSLFILVLTPTFLGLGVAMSRLTDFRHHVVDVLMGIFLGLVCSTLVFLRTIRCLDG